MAKQVRILSMPDLAMNETDVRVLRLIAGRVGRHRKPVEVSQPVISRELGVSMGTVRRAIRSLVSNELIVVSERYLENGCRMENAYLLTARGKRVLKALPAPMPASEEWAGGGWLSVHRLERTRVAYRTNLYARIAGKRL